MKVGIYARVSTIDKGQDVGIQVGELEAYAKARGWTVLDQYLDEGISGSKERRPGLDRLLTACRRRQIDIVLVWRLDRLGRSLKHLIMMLDELKSLGVAFVALHEQIDCTTATGQLMLHLLGAFAEFERALIRERVKAGLAHAQSKGQRLGRPRLEIDLTRVKSLRKDGRSIRQIAQTLHVSPASVHKTLNLMAS
ncbi:MAG: recombinase family protein [Nitrospirae bacterium]|nr:recombinase family protein [Nitrospirota bacterium]